MRKYKRSRRQPVRRYKRSAYRTRRQRYRPRQVGHGFRSTGGTPLSLCYDMTFTARQAAMSPIVFGTHLPVYAMKQNQAPGNDPRVWNSQRQYWTKIMNTIGNFQNVFLASVQLSFIFNSADTGVYQVDRFAGHLDWIPGPNNTSVLMNDTARVMLQNLTDTSKTVMSYNANGTNILTKTFTNKYDPVYLFKVTGTINVPAI